MKARLIIFFIDGHPDNVSFVEFLQVNCESVQQAKELAAVVFNERKYSIVQISHCPVKGFPGRTCKRFYYRKRTGLSKIRGWWSDYPCWINVILRKIQEWQNSGTLSDKGLPCSFQVEPSEAALRQAFREYPKEKRTASTRMK